MTVARYVCVAIGGPSVLGALLPGATGRFGRTPAPPLTRPARVGMAVFGLLWLGLTLTCGTR